VLLAEIGEIVGPIETEYGYHIIQVNGREVRTLTESEMQSRRSQAFVEWVDSEKALADIKRRGDWQDRVPEDPSYNQLLGDILPVS
jgi:parvulin-like peptidyl-prolyl isomerase